MILKLLSVVGRNTTAFETKSHIFFLQDVSFYIGNFLDLDNAYMIVVCMDSSFLHKLIVTICKLRNSYALSLAPHSKSLFLYLLS
jgi:hypothetical protein